MKKWIALFLILSLCLPLFACTDESGTEEGSENESAETTDISQETDTPAVPPETPGESETEPPTEPSEEPVTVNWLSDADLSDDRKETAEQYFRLLVYASDVSQESFLSEEVRENWDYREGGKKLFTVRSLFWEDEDQFILYGTRSVKLSYGDVQRTHLIHFVKIEDGWQVRKDVYSDNDLSAVKKDRDALVNEALEASRKQAPLTEKLLQAAKDAAIAHNMNMLTRQMDDVTKAFYREHLEAVYDPEWEAETLPGILNLETETLLEKSPLLLWVRFAGAKDGSVPEAIQKLYRKDCYGWTFLLFYEGDQWKATMIGNRNQFEPDPPKSTLDPNAPRKAVELDAKSSSALTPEAREVLLWYADLLLNDWDPSGLDRVSDEIKTNWGWLYGADPQLYLTSVLWNDDELLVVYCSFQRPEDYTTREHLIRFVQKDGLWYAEKDILGSGMLLYDIVPEDAAEILKDLIYRARARKPLTEEDLKEIEEAVIEREMEWGAIKYENAYEQSLYKSGLSVKYDPDWEEQYLNNLFGPGNYMVPTAMVYLVSRAEPDRSHPWRAYYTEEEGWAAYFLNEGWAPEPEPLSFTEENWPIVTWSASAGRLAASIQFTYTGKADTNYTFTRTEWCSQDLVRGKCDLLLSGEPTSEMLSDAAYQGVSLQFDRIGSDPFVFFVSKDNPVESLTLQEIRDIYSGKITNWKEVGGKDAEILAFQQPTNSVSQNGMKMLVMQDETMMEPLTRNSLWRYVGDSYLSDVIMRFDESENALGYAYQSYANALYLNDNVKVLAVEGVLPEAEAVRSGDYPLIGGIYAITRKGDKSENTKKLLRGLLSPSGQNCVSEAGFVPVLHVGEYTPEKRAASDEPVLSLSDTYETNPVRVLTKTDSYEGFEYQYGVLVGLSDQSVTGKINQILHDDALACLKKSIEKISGVKDAALKQSITTEFNAENLLSVRTWTYFYHTSEPRYGVQGSESTIGTNVRLDTGERLTLQDLFRDDAEGKDIFNQGSYWEILAKMITGTPKHHNYQNVEDRLLLFIRRYDEGDAFDFYFTPKCVSLLGEKGTQSNLPLNVWFSECVEAAALYGKYADQKVAYDGTYESCTGIPVLTDRDDPLRNTIEKADGYFLDIALYEGSNEMEGDTVLTEACREAMMKAYEEYVQELRERLEKKASEGVYLFCNPTAAIHFFEDGKAYFIAFENNYLELGSREELDALCELGLEEIRSPYWNQPAGGNHYIVGIGSYTPEMFDNLLFTSMAVAFDEQGNLVSKEGRMFREDAPAESQN